MDDTNGCESPGRRGSARHLVAVLLVMVPPACTSGGPIPCPTDAAEVEIGTGASDWIPLEDGETLSFFHGPQGGYHVYGSQRARGIEPGDLADPYSADNPRVSFEVEVEDVVVAQFVDQPRALTPGADGWSFYVGQTVVFTDSDPTGFDGAAARFRTGVEDRCGAAAEDARDVLLHYELE